MKKGEFLWQDFGHPKLKLLKEKFDLEGVVNEAEGEYERQMLLKSWVFGRLPLGYNNPNLYLSAEEVLDDRNNPGGFNCSWYVLVYLQCAQALGWNVRKLGIDSNHGFGEEEMRHTVVDVWSEEHEKWYVIDPMFNVHFEVGDVPLDAYEIRRAGIEGKQVRKVFGNYEKEVTPVNVKDRHDCPGNYFWFFVLMRNNFLENPNVYDSKAFLWVDRFNKGKVWFVGGENKGEFRKHPMYEGGFVETDNYGLCFPRVK